MDKLKHILMMIIAWNLIKESLNQIRPKLQLIYVLNVRKKWIKEKNGCYNQMEILYYIKIKTYVLLLWVLK